MQSVVGYTDLQEERVSVRARVGQGGGGSNWSCIPTANTWVVCIKVQAATEVMTAVTPCAITVLFLFCTDSLSYSFRCCLLIRHLSCNFYFSVSLITLQIIYINFFLINTVISNQKTRNTSFPMSYWAGFAWWCPKDVSTDASLLCPVECPSSF